jgi:hypothetical protein
MAIQKAYDTGQKTADLIPTEFVVGEKTFKVKRSGKALKKIVTLVPDDESGEDPLKNIEMMYEGISLVLVDTQRDPETSEEDTDGVWHPKVGWLEEEVDFEVAKDFMEKILPQRAEGNSSAPSAPSTDNDA